MVDRSVPWPANFGTAIWEKCPGVFEDSGSGLHDECTVFEGIVRAADDFRSGAMRDHHDLKFHVGDAVVVDPSPYLPNGSDNLDQYLARLRHLLSERPFTLLINNFQEFSPDMCRRLRLFARNILEHLGMLPAGMVSSHVLLARYGVSPFAVHKDPNSVFTFMVRGRKTLRVWPFEALAHRTKRPFARHRQVNLYNFDYRPIQSTGLPLEGDIGNVLYWPSTFWHVGEANPNSVHISIHLTFDVHSEPRGEVLDLLSETVEGSLSEADWHGSYSIGNVHGGLIEPPEQLNRALCALTEELQSSLADSLTVQWLRRMSAQGFSTLARSESSAKRYIVDPGRTLLQGDAAFPVYWMMADGSVTLAAHGRVIRFPIRAWTDDFLTAVSSARGFRITELGQQWAPEWDAITAVATRLIEIGAVSEMGMEDAQPTSE